jgi:hypothetical protein
LQSWAAVDREPRRSAETLQTHHRRAATTVCGSARTAKRISLSLTARLGGYNGMPTSARLNPATLVTPTVRRLAAKLSHDQQRAIGSERYGGPTPKHERSL